MTDPTPPRKGPKREWRHWNLDSPHPIRMPESLWTDLQAIADHENAARGTTRGPDRLDRSKLVRDMILKPWIAAWRTTHPDVRLPSDDAGNDT